MPTKYTKMKFNLYYSFVSRRNLESQQNNNDSHFSVAQPGQK